MGSARLPLLVVWVAYAISLFGLAQGEESVVHAKVGGVAELGCILAPPSPDATPPPLFPLHVVEWVRRGFDVPVLIKFGPYAPRVHPSFEGRVSLSRGAALLVEKVRLQDEGWYECQILRLNRTTSGPVNGTWIFLSVSAPPVFAKTPPPVIEAMQGDSLALTCGAHGNPQPTITWTKDDIAVGKGEETEVMDGTLTLGTVTRGMAGVYKCQVSNREGSLTHTTQLRVKGPPAILLPPEDTMLNMSQNAQLRCRAEAYPPNMTYVWWRHGENVYHIDSLKSRVKILVDGTLLIPKLIPEDSGNYTCMPTNGLLTPPTASAYLTVKHPAQVVQMPQVTYLPAGLGGRINCPVRAEPPLLSVHWTKDGQVLDLNMFPGWMLMADGSIFIAAANEDAVATYTCTPYNSYGTMGPSQPTQVVLQDPPLFTVLPQEEYEQEVATQLVIPCHAQADPTPSLTWAKVGPAPRSPYTVAANGSLVLHMLSKDHHGVWECLAANRVATITASTHLSVLGTTPHAVSSLSADPGTNQVNVSWVPGFDGGSAQKFTVWMKQTSGQKPEWVSLPVPTSAPYLLVTGLLPGTEYQFSVLPHNAVGAGPFSEIAAVQTLVLLTDPPPAVPELAPPTSLSANQSLTGIVLMWVQPAPQAPPITGFILQSRKEGEVEWHVLEGDIGANESDILLQGLKKDCSYELRMLSVRDGLVSTPSEPLNVSTAGMGVFPARPRLLEAVPDPQMAGVLAGVGVVCAVLLLLLGAVCFLNRSKHCHQRRHRKRGDIPDALQKCPPQGKIASRTDSPDSVLQMKACLLNTIFPKFPGSRSDLSSSSSEEDSGCSECQEQDRRLLSQPRPKSCLWGCSEGEGSDAPLPAALESISRGPDGRFVVRACDDDGSASGCVEEVPACPGGGGNSRVSSWACGRPCSLCSEKDDLAVVLSVDLPDIGTGSSSDSDTGTDPCGSTRLCTPVATLPRRGGREDRVGFLPQEGAWDLVDGRALVSQMERERESGHLSRCLALAREREALERELERCEARLSLRAWRKECWDSSCAPEDWALPDGGGRRLLSGGVEVGGGHWRAPSQGSAGKSVSMPTKEVGSDKRKKNRDSFTQISTDPSQRHFLRAGDEERGRDDRGHSPGSTWPYSRGGGGGAHTTGGTESLGMTPNGTSTLSFPGPKNEVSRADLWNGDQRSSDGTCGKSRLTSLTGNDVTCSRPDISVSQISGSVRPSLMPLSYNTPNLNTNPVLKYLSLPGFVEMNVDEPVDESRAAPSRSKVAWAAHAQKGTEPAGPAPGPGGEHRRHSARPGAAGGRGRTASSEERPPGWDRTLRRPLKRSQSLTCGTPAGRGRRGGGSDFQGGRASWGQFQTVGGPGAQASRTRPLPSVCDNMPHGRGQAATASVNKTFSRVPSRTQREAPPKLEVRKTASLRLKTGERRTDGENPVSQAFPSPEVWVRSLSLGGRSRPGPLRGTPSRTQELPPRSLALAPSPPATGPGPVSLDPRRQATVFLEAPRFPASYQEAPPLLLRSTPPLRPCPPNSTQDCQAPHLSGRSQPSGTPFAQRGPEQEREEQQREEQQGAEEAVGGSREEEGRGSYASQSSGRGSLGPLSGQSSSPGPSPCPSPSLPSSSPPTLQEGKPGGRRRVSVDENYEWDAADVSQDSAPCRASHSHPDQKRGRGSPQATDLHSQGEHVNLSSCGVDYQLSPESTYSKTRDFDTVLF